MKFSLWIMAAAIAISSCQQPADETSQSSGIMNDPHSFANMEEAVLKHLNLNLNLDFDAQVIRGEAELHMDCYGAESIILDTDDMKIVSVTSEGADLNWRMGAFDDLRGTPLVIELGGPRSSDLILNVTYETTPAARALQWLSPEQTNGKSMPFMFTQSQAILARSWVPCQDGPGVRFTYDADVQVPVGMMAVMSASNPTEKSEDGRYHFEMTQPIPSYLLALAAGDLEFQSTGPRTGVYAEAEILEASAWEFAETEDMIQAAEGLYGPYAWEKYDLLILPPSFPFGGMENPRLTFLTPTVIAGDRSLVSLIAHELAHSWSGNLVTNATWNDFWLNEGFTVYFEHRIMEEVYGAEYTNMLRALSYSGLRAEVDGFMASNTPEDTKLAIELSHRNPDDGMTAIAYDKGFHFLMLCEEQVGRDAFDDFLKNYFDTNKFQSMTTDRFIAHLREKLIDDATWESMRGEEWVYGDGLPENCPRVDPVRFQTVDQTAEAFLTTELALTYDNWSTHEWLRFIERLRQADPSLTAYQCASLDQTYHFTASNNAEILAVWFQLGISSGYQAPEFRQKVGDFLTQVGRRKFLTPTYKAMIDAGDRTWALEIYGRARSGYHAVSVETLDALLGWEH